MDSGRFHNSGWTSRLPDDVPEYNKWLANDYCRVIERHWPKADNFDYDAMTAAILLVHGSFWRHGDPKGKLTDDMPEDERARIYWLKTYTAYNCQKIMKRNTLLKDKIERAEYNDSAFSNETESDVIRNEEMAHALIEWVRENLWDYLERESIPRKYGRSKMGIPGDTDEIRKFRANKMADVLERYYLDGEYLKDMAKELNQSVTGIGKTVRSVVEFLRQHSREILADID